MKLIKLMKNGKRMKVTSAKNFSDLKAKIVYHKDTLANCLLYLDEHTRETENMGLPDWADLHDQSSEALTAQEKMALALFG